MRLALGIAFFVAASSCVSGAPAPCTPCNGVCVDTNVDPSNCGACGTACADGQICLAGTCKATCKAPLTVCGATCVDSKNDPANCGGCGSRCNAGQFCSGGSCTGSCPSPLVTCGTSCVDLQSSHDHCLTCGTACTADQFCQAGACVPTCPAPLTRCGAACIDPSTDNNNCGGCGTVCAGGTRCQAEHCTCGSGLSACVQETYIPDGGLVDAGVDAGAPLCVSTSSDRKNCGGCNVYCENNLACVNGACRALASCAAWANTQGPLTDGEYMIAPPLPDGGALKPFSIYCKDMNTPTPTEYLTVRSLFSTDAGYPGIYQPSTNYVLYGPGGACVCKYPFVRAWTKVRLSVPSLTVVPTDFTFSTASEPNGVCWSLQSGACGSAPSTPYGTAANCASAPSVEGLANIDLTGTPFSIDPSVTWVVMAGTGGATLSPDRTMMTNFASAGCADDGPTGPIILKQN